MKPGTQKKDYALSHHIPRGLPFEEQIKADATADPYGQRRPARRPGPGRADPPNL